MNPDYYSLLQVAPHAEPEIITAAYRRLAWMYHPDSNKSADAAERMRLINEAYNLLKDPERRAEYDKQRTGGPEAQAAVTPSAPPFACESCGRVDPTLRAAVFLYIVSFIVGSLKRGGGAGILCADCRRRRGLRYSLITFLLGPWGIPWGPMWTLFALSTNAHGGQQPPEVNGPLLRVLGMYFSATGHPAEAVQALQASLDYEPLSQAREQIQQIEREQALAGKKQLEGDKDTAAREPHREIQPRVLVGGAIAIYMVACLAIAAISSGVALQAYGKIITPTAVAALAPTEEPTAAPPPTETLSPSPTATSTNAPTLQPAEGFAPVTVIPGLTPIAGQRLYICVAVANVRAGPGTTFDIVRRLTRAYFVTAYGAVEDWYYIGYNTQGVDQYVNRAVVCEQPVATATPGRAPPRAVPQPTATPGLCADYVIPWTPNLSRDRGGLPPIRGMIRPSGVKVFFDIADAEYWDPNERGESVYFNCPKEAQAQGFTAIHPK